MTEYRVQNFIQTANTRVRMRERRLSIAARSYKYRYDGAMQQQTILRGVHVFICSIIALFALQQ